MALGTTGPAPLRETSNMYAGHIDLDEALELETKVWDALRRGDADEDARLLADDFLGVYPSGFAGRSDHAGQLANGPAIGAFALRRARLMVLSDNDVLLSYRADFHRFDGDPRDDAEAMYVSSVWSRRADRWVNVFSQDSLADDNHGR